jgi:ribosome-associated translation inhibitor RaiA
MMAEAQSQHQSELTQRGVKAVEEAIGEKYRKLQLPESERYKPHAIARAIVDFGNDGQIKAYQQRNGEVVYDLTPEAKKTEIGRFIATHRGTMEIVNEYGSGNAEWAVDLTFDNMINKTRGAEQVEKLQELLPPSRREKARQAAEEKRRQERAEAEKQGVQTMEDVEADTRDEVDALTGRVNAKEAVSNKITFKKGDRPQVVGELVRVERSAGGEIQAVVRTPEGDTEVSMDEMVQVGGTGVARVLVYAKHHSEMTTEEINALVGLTERTAEQKVTSSQVIAAYEAGVRAGYAGEDKPALETVARTPYGDKAVQTLETAMEMGHGMGKRQAAADEKNRTEGISTTARGEGGVAFMGDVENAPDVTDTGVREDVETIMQDLTPQQNAAVRVLKTMSEASGIGITLFRTKVADGEEIQTPNGFYDPNTNSIFIDLQAGASKGGEAMVESAILKTASHELTHFIEQNTQGEYAELREEAKKLLRERGKSYAKLIDEKLRNLGNVDTRAQAEAEVIAEACEMMLKDSAAAEMMAKNNPSLWQKMTDWLKDFVAGFSRWVKRAFSGITATSEEAQALTEIRDGVERYIGDLQKIWDNALVVAAGREPAAETTESKAVTPRAQVEEIHTAARESEDVETDAGDAAVDSTESGAIVSEEDHSAYMPQSARTWMTSDYIRRREEMANALAEKTGVTPEKAEQWIKDVTGIAQTILAAPTILDYVPSKFGTPFKSNPEYGGSIDMSTMCPKRAIATGTLDAIQKILGDVAMDRNDFLRIRQMMKDRGYEVACGLCFVESSRANMSKYVSQFVESYRKTHKDTEISMPMFNTVEGLEATRENNPDMYQAFEEFMNKLAQRKPKLFEKRTEYTNEILKAFMNDNRVSYKNKMGGLRIQSFSDFEVIHLIDMMQVITDMSAVGLNGQAYTKQADFAWALGDTNLKINLSLIAKGVDENGKLIFDHKEGMDPKVAKELRDTYSKNVGTVVVVFTNEQIIAAMKDPFVDFIIPFHRSQWQKSDYKMLGLPAKTRDYTLHQNERHRWMDDNGKWHTTKHEEGNLLPNDIWDFTKSGTENAEMYLDRCFNEGRIPKFPFLLDKGADGRYTLKKDGSTDGYWKLLIDFKMYDNDGNPSPQTPVVPNFNMEQCYRMLREYKGGHETLPVAQDVVEDYVKEFRSRRGVQKVAPGEKVTIAEPYQYSRRRGKPDLSVRDAMMAITKFTDMTPGEQSLLNRYQSNVLRLQEVTEAIAAQTAIRDNKETPEKERGKAKQELWRLRRQMFAIERALIDAENERGYAKLMTTAGEMVRLLTTRDSLPEVTQALQEQIAKVTEQLAAVQSELGEKSEEDMWNTIRSLFDQKKLRAAAKKLKERYGSRISEKTLMNRIVLMQTTLLRGGENATAEYMRLGEELVRELRSKSQQENDMLATMKEYIGTISLTDAQRQEINNTIGMKEFMSVVRPVVKVVPKGKGSVTLDVLLDEANAAEGGANPLLPYFEGHMGEGDSILHLYNLIKGAKTANTFVGRYGQEQLQAEMIDVMGIAAEAALVDAGAETVKTVMDALTKNAEGSDALTAKVRQLRVEMTKAGRAAGAAAWKADERHKAMGDVIEYLTHMEMMEKILADLDTKRIIERQVADESNKRIKEIIAERNVMEENRVMRDRIRRTVGWMVTRIRRETDRKNVPEELKPYIEDAIRIFAEYNDVLRVFKKTEVADIRKYFDALKKYDTKTEGKLNDLIAEELGESFKELRVYLEEYGEASTKGHKSKTMIRNKSLKAIDGIVETMWGQIKTWNEIYIDGQQAQLSEVAGKTVSGLIFKKDYAIRDNVAGRAWEKVVDAVRNKNMTPQYFFRLLKETDVMQKLYNDVVKGQREYGVMLAAAKKRLEEIQAKHNYWAWKNADPLEFATEQGKLSMTVEEAMSVWAIWKREQDTNPMFESTHLSEGGIILNNGYRKVDGKLVKDNTPRMLDEEDLEAIEKSLTEEQKAYAAEIVEYMSKDMAEVGNRASMRLYGIKKFKEEHYFPMRVHRDQLVQSSNKAAKNPDANRIAGMASAHRRTARAWKPLAISGFTEVAANHINEMLLYGTFAVPIENFNAVLNYNYTQNIRKKATEEDEPISSMTVRAFFRQKYGDNLTSYLETFLADLNGGTGVRENNKLMSLYKRSAVMASVSVMLQQPLSIIRAWYVQNPKYYLKALSGKTAAPERKEWEQLCKYSGAAVLKSIGGFDMTSTRTMGGYLAGTAEDTYSLAKKAGALVGVNAEGERLAGAKRQADELLGLGAQKADQMAWTYMWMATKAEVAERNPRMDTSSEEFLRLAADRFEEVVNLTQVYDSTLVRSQNMRSKSVFAKMATSFMAEPTLTLNMLLDGYNRKDKKSIVKAAGIFILSQLATAAVKSLWTAGRNDDEEKPWLEKYLAAVGGELGGYGGSLNPLNLIPYARDAMSLLEGYDVERADMALVVQLLNEATKWINGGYEDDPAKGAKNMAFALANMLGVPLKNIWRDVSTGVNTWKDATTDKRDVNVKVLRKEAMSNFLPWVDVSNDAYYTKLYEAMKKGDVKEVEALRVFMGTQGKDEDAVNAGVKGVVGDLYLDKKLTETEAKAFLLENGLVKDDKAAFRAVDGWTEKAEHKGEKDYSYGVYDTLHESIADYDAKAVEAEIKQLTANGWTDKEVRQELRSHVYEEYRKGNVTRSEAERILKQHGGYKAEEVSDPDFWYWTFREQDVKKTDPDEGFSRYDALYDALDKGSDAGVKAAVKELTEHGYTQQEAESKAYSHLFEQYRKGEMTWTQVQTLAKKHAGKGDLDANDWYWEKKKQDWGKANGGSTDGYAKYADYYKAVETGVNIKTVTQEYLTHGIEAQELAANITKQYKEEYIRLYKTNKTAAANLQNRLLNAYTLMGYDRQKKIKDIAKWLE